MTDMRAFSGRRGILLPFLIAAAEVLLSLSCAAAPVQSVYPGDRLMWNHINDVPPVVLQEAPGGVILPHHTMTAREAARIYKGLAEKIQPRTVFILCPDHYESGGSRVITADNISFETVYGRLDVDGDLAEKLSAQTGALRCSRPFKNEHGVYFHAPFIKKYFPGARIVPVLLPWRNAEESNSRIAAFIARNSSDKTFVIASVDCSHFQIRDAADFHDESTFDAVINFRMGKLYHCEIDSPPSAYVCMSVMDQLGCRKAVRLLHTNSDEFVKRREPSTTSHQYFAFYKGEPAPDSRLTVFIAGTIGAENGNLFVQQYWDWNREADPEKESGARKYLRHLRGQEDRFLSGADLYLFDTREDEREEIFTAAGQRVAVISFRDDPSAGLKSTDKIRQLKKTNDRVLVIFRYAGGARTDSYRQLFRSWIDAGASLVAGRGIPQSGVERYGRGIILYSPGDFIPRNGNASGAVYGIVFTGGTIAVKTFRLKIINGYPQLAAGEFED